MTEQQLSTARCSFLAGLLGDPLAATALEVTGWILVEHSGPWGKNALRESGLDPSLVREIEEKMDTTGVRVQLVSPPGDAPPGSCYVAGDPRGILPPWFVRVPGADLEKVLALDFAAIAAGRQPAHAEPAHRPFYMVCANEESDPCCGSTGRQVYTAAAAEIGPDRCRRTAHVGGHKFAANMVVFPNALYYGRLDPRSVLDVQTATEAGQVYTDKYRGRSTFSIAEQAAEHFVRRRFGALGINAVSMVAASTELDKRTRRVRLAVAGHGQYDLVVVAREQEPARMQSCTDKRPTVPVEWDLVELAPVGTGSVGVG